MPGRVIHGHLPSAEIEDLPSESDSICGCFVNFRASAACTPDATVADRHVPHDLAVLHLALVGDVFSIGMSAGACNDIELADAAGVIGMAMSDHDVIGGW